MSQAPAYRITMTKAAGCAAAWPTSEVHCKPPARGSLCKEGEPWFSMSGSGPIRSSAGLLPGSFYRLFSCLFGSRPAFAPFADVFEFFVREVLNADKRILGRADPDKLIQLD